MSPTPVTTVQERSTVVTRIRDRGEPVARVAVPVALAVVTWLVVLLAVGLVARLGSLSLLGLLPTVLVVGVLCWPLSLLGPWRPGVADRVLDGVNDHRDALAATAVLLVGRTLPGTGVVGAALNVPFRSAGVIFDAAVFYRQLVAPAAGQFLLAFGQWYLELFWLFLLGTVLARLVEVVR